MKTSIVMPCRNEAEVIGTVLEHVKSALDGLDCELVVVAHRCTDNTAQVASDGGARVVKCEDPHLADAMLCGFNFSEGDSVIWMDGDGQHPPEALPEVIKALEHNDMVIASRNVRGGSYSGFTKYRRVVSAVANVMALPLIPRIKDRTTGFFGIHRNVLNGNTKLNLVGYKFPLEVFVKGDYKTLKEVPYTFMPRIGGTSKLSKRVMTAYIKQLIPLYLHKFRWLRFGLVGLVGAGVNFPILYALTEFAGLPYLAAAVAAIVCASTSNYFLNHIWTFRERRAGHNHLLGWLKYQGMSGITDAAYLGVLALLTEIGQIWYMASAALAILVVFILKYYVAGRWIWRSQQK